MFCGYLPPSWHKTNEDSYKDWAISCQFKHKEFKTEIVGIEDCIRLCQTSSKCTHFNWELDINNNNLTICKLINGTVSKVDAYHTRKPNVVCGIKENKIIDPLHLPKIGIVWSETWESAGGGGGKGGPCPPRPAKISMVFGKNNIFFVAF